MKNPENGNIINDENLTRIPWYGISNWYDKDISSDGVSL